MWRINYLSQKSGGKPKTVKNSHIGSVDKSINTAPFNKVQISNITIFEQLSNSMPYVGGGAI